MRLLDYCGVIALFVLAASLFSYEAPEPSDLERAVAERMEKFE